MTQLHRRRLEMPNDEAVDRNLQGMDDLDFVRWNNADWTGAFAHHHTDDVLVDWQGQPTTHGIEEHIEAMKSYVEENGAVHRRRSRLTRSSSGQENGRASSGSSRTAPVW
jgi:hypothetical protein